MFDIIKIFSWVKKNLTKKDFFLIAVFTLTYWLTRLIRLDRFPVFTDEGIYIHWAKVAWHDASWRFISLTDGKQPLQTWATIPFLKLFPDNSLLAGRLFSVSAGFISLIGVFLLLFYLFGKKSAFIGAFIYIFNPYFLFYDRMALTDSAVNAGAIWLLFFSILLIKTLRLDVALLLGLTGGAALLTKSSSKMFLALSSLSPLILIINSGIKKNLNKIINFILLFLTVIVMSVIIYNIQRLSPFLHYVAIKNKTFVMTLDEFLKAPFSTFFGNLRIVLVYVIWESGWLIPMLGTVGLVSLYKKDRGLALYLLVWLILPLLAIASFSKVIFPRYLIFFASLFVVLASYLLNQFKTKNLLISILLISVFFIYLDYPILFDFKKISFPEVDRGQYVEGPPAGWGVKEIVDFARTKSIEKPVILLAEGNFGLVADMLDVFLKRGDRIEIRGYWPLDEKELFDNQKELKNKYVYVVFSHRTEFPQDWPIRLIKKFDKPGKKSAIYLYELRKITSNILSEKILRIEN